MGILEKKNERNSERLPKENLKKIAMEIIKKSKRNSKDFPLKISDSSL